MVRLENISFAYPPNRRVVFRGLNLRIPGPSWVSLTGPEGAGKSTLGKLIHGMLRPDEGTITRGTGSDDFSVGYLGGDPYDFLVGISVEEEIVFGLENMCLSRADMEGRLHAALAWTGMQGMEKRPTHTLSGGQQQKLALASMLAMDPRIMVLDETMGMLDRPTRRSIRGFILRLMSDPRTQTPPCILEITHCLEDVLTTERVIFLDAGVIRFDGTPEEFVSDRLGQEWFGLTPEQARSLLRNDNRLSNG